MRPYRTIALFGWLCMVTPLLSPTRGCAEHVRPRVVVIGAGLAGLTTAYRLHQQGVDVHVYEARGRVGGRILSGRLGDTTVEFGGQNITDGGDADHLCALASELQLAIVRGQLGLDVGYFDGERCRSGEELNCDRFHSDRLESELTELAHRSDTMQTVLKSLLPQEDELYRSLAVRLAGYQGGTPERLSAIYVDTLYHMLLGGLCSVHPGRLGERPAIDVAQIQGGNSLLPERLAEALRGRITLNAPLVGLSRSHRSYTLRFKSGAWVEADLVVLAIPCSVYKEVDFQEGVVPSERLGRMQQVEYGTNGKIFVPFPRLSQEMTPLVCDEILSWCADPEVLTLYYTGEAGDFSAQTIGQAYQLARAMMEAGFGALAPPWTAPGFAEDRPFLSYDGPVGYGWTCDPYVLGSYSYIAAGQESWLPALHDEEGELVRTLFAPIDHSLYFVGEHTAVSLDILGTMEAACESGERIARMILRSL